MSAEVELSRDESSLDILPPAQRPAQAAMEMLRCHAQLMQMAYDLAEGMCKTQLVPTRFRGKPQDGTAAILYGMELGLNPIQALQRVIPINGQPTLEALTMTALLEGKGYTIKVIEETPQLAEVHGWKPGRDPRTDEPDACYRRDIDWAIRARYAPTPSGPDSLRRPDVDTDWVTTTKTWEGKTRISVVGNMRYITDPQAMLVAKCRALVCKELAPQILLGLAGSTEEMHSERGEIDEPAKQSGLSAGAALTVEEIIGGSTVESAIMNEYARDFRDKVKHAAPIENLTIPAEERHDETPQENTTGDPGEDNPVDGSAQKVMTPVLNAARTGAMSQTAREKLIASINELFAAVDCLMIDDQRIVIATILQGKQAQPVPAAHELNLPDGDLKKIFETLNFWWNAKILGEKVRDILNAYDIATEEKSQHEEETQ